MNTDPKNNEPVQGLQLHPEQLSTDTNPRTEKQYEVILFYTQTSRVRKIVMAENLAQAKDKAWEIEAGDIWEADLDPVDGELYVDTVKLVKEGENHE
jgi:hypothetical protein